MRVFATGFGPFGNHDINPSQVLVEASGLPNEILTVSFEAVDQFIHEFDPSSFDALLHVGVAGLRSHFSLEGVARNTIGPVADVYGIAQGPGSIDPKLPFQVSGTLWHIGFEDWLPGNDQEVQHTQDAGGYLCNYIYFRSVTSFPTLKVGFLHVPDTNLVSLDQQLPQFLDIVQRLKSI